MKFLAESTISQLKDGDINAFVELDEHGLIIGPGESTTEFIERAIKLRDNVDEFTKRIKTNEEIEFYGFTLRYEDAIPKDVFKEANNVTKSLFGFAIDWVPGYFCDNKMGILFAGCALYSQKDAFAVFVIRKAFQKSFKWLIYSRKELLAHELTHIARLAFKTPAYEEVMAFKSGGSRFRRVIGGMFRKASDVYCTLGTIVLLTIYQIGNIFMRPPEKIWAMPTPIAFMAALAPAAYLLTRLALTHSKLRRANTTLKYAYPNANATSILFRCSENEIKTMATIKQDDLIAWIDAKRIESIRWQVIHKRFLES